MAPFYTRKGDQGYTGFLGKGRIPKYHPRPDALGTIDEAGSLIGLARAHCLQEETKSILLTIQRDLYKLMSEIAAPPGQRPNFQGLDHQQVEWLEMQIDKLGNHTQMPGEFIIPGDHPAGAMLDVARTVVRRAERTVARLVHQEEFDNPYILSYLNRLSSLLFVLELVENKLDGVQSPTLAREK